MNFNQAEITAAYYKLLTHQNSHLILPKET